MRNFIVHNKTVLLLILAVALILLVPFLAMQFTDEVAWSPFDFVCAGTLLFGTGIAYVLITRKAVTTTYQVATGIALLAAMLLVWINLAVGIIGSEDNPANMLYFGVLAILISGALIARFQPKGMAGALFVTALAQVVVPVTALFIWKLDSNPAEVLLEVLRVAGVTMLFVIMWVGSGLLFRGTNAAPN